MIRRRRTPAAAPAAPPAPAEADPRGAQAWTAYYARQAGLLPEPEPVPDPRTLADPVRARQAARTLAMRGGVFTESPPTTGM